MIWLGTSGFSYPDWDGAFYPPEVPARERLDYYAERFCCVEINSTYYGQPNPRTTAGWAARVPAGFRFAVKVYGGITHRWREATAADLADFARGLEPLRESGRLGAVLAQFPNSFRPTRESVGHLRRLRESWPDLPLVVEFRHRDWASDRAFSWLANRQLGCCVVDEPDLPGLMPPVARVTAPPAYLRFHGRNAARWYNHAEAWERYDYRYSLAELRSWAPQVAELHDESEELYIFFNNHYEGQAALNAAELRDILHDAGAPLAGG